MSKAIFVMQIGCVLIQFIYFLNKIIKYYKKMANYCLVTTLLTIYLITF